MPRKPFRRFESLETEIVWAAVERLDIAARHSLLEELTNELFVEPHLRAQGPSAREARAVLALREAARALGKSPSIQEYAELVQLHPENRWPHPSRVRAWLGSNSWNRALERAGLEAVEVDVTIRERLGSVFAHETLKKALRLAAAEFGNSFTFEQYNHWVRRPDVVAEHGLLPRAVATFITAFGSWSNAFVAAGLRETHVIVTKHGVVRHAAHSYERDEVIEALQFAADEIGHTPTVGEYTALRKKIQEDSPDQALVTLPSVVVIKRLLDKDWAAACVVAGLDDPGESVSAPFSDEELIESLAAALEQGCRSAADYDGWRETLRVDAEAVGASVRIPSATLIRKRLSGWRRARAAAEELLELGG